MGGWESGVCGGVYDEGEEEWEREEERDPYEWPGADDFEYYGGGGGVWDGDAVMMERREVRGTRRVDVEKSVS